jgi:uncharacterized heparinase superfamily protein
MGKPLPWLWKQAPTSSSPVPQPSPADRPATATTSPSFAAAETAREPAPHKLNRHAHARELADAAAEAFGAIAARNFYRTKFWQRGLNGPAPDRILVNPRCFYRKSMAEAELLIMGRFRLPGGDATARDGSPFFIQSPSELWSESLHSFHWLRHFDAGGSDPVQEHLRQLIAHWVRAYGNWHELAWRPHVLARRLITWASFGRLILQNADVLFRSRVLLSMARQARHLSKTARTAAPGMPRLTAAIGLVQSGVCLPDGDWRMNKGLHMLAEELGDQVLPDGGHVSRNPENVLAVASDLLALMDAMTQRDLIIPVAIRRALDRMMPMIRFLQHGDGRLALFNGGTESSDGWAHALLTYDSGRNKTPLMQACGYSRIVCGNTLLIADVGQAPKGLLSTGAHAGCLSFELSAGEERIVVNCGASALKGAHWTQAMRATAAHSTLILADTSSAHAVAEPWAARLLGTRLVDGPTRVEAKRRESEDGIHLDASHDGYLAPMGLIHERRWFVSHDGNDIRGEDRLVPNEASTAPRAFAVRFHLHPTVKAMRLPDGRAIVLTLPSGATWRFGADAALEIADSVYLGAGDAIRKTQQIVIAGTTGAEPVSVKWALKKITGATAEPLVN